MKYYLDFIAELDDNKWINQQESNTNVIDLTEIFDDKEIKKIEDRIEEWKHSLNPAKPIAAKSFIEYVLLYVKGYILTTLDFSVEKPVFYLYKASNRPTYKVFYTKYKKDDQVEFQEIAGTFDSKVKAKKLLDFQYNITSHFDKEETSDALYIMEKKIVIAKYTIEDSEVINI